jgi:hypothetical protein
VTVAYIQPTLQLICSLYLSFLSKTSTKPLQSPTVPSCAEKRVQKHGTKTLKGERRSSEREREDRGNLVACSIHHHFLRVTQFFLFTTVVNKIFSLSWLHIHALSRGYIDVSQPIRVCPPLDISTYTS